MVSVTVTLVLDPGFTRGRLITVQPRLCGFKLTRQPPNLLISWSVVDAKGACFYQPTVVM